MHYHVKFRQNWSNGWRYMAICYFSRWRPSAILDFQIKKIAADWLWGSQLHHRANFRQHRSNGWEIWQFFDFSRWRLSANWICGHILGPSTKSIWRSLSSDKIWFEYFAHLAGNWLFMSPILVFWAIWAPKWEAVSMQPQEAHPCVETRRMTYRSLKSVNATCARDKETKKER